MVCAFWTEFFTRNEYKQCFSSEVEPDDGKEILVEDDQNLELTAGWWLACNCLWSELIAQDLFILFQQTICRDAKLAKVSVSCIFLNFK